MDLWFQNKNIGKPHLKSDFLILFKESLFLFLLYEKDTIHTSGFNNADFSW